MKPARRRTGSCVALGLALLVAPGLSVWGIGLAVLWLATVVVLMWLFRHQAKRHAARRRAVEQALRESEQRFRIVTETAPDAIITIDQTSRILFANRATERIFGYSIDELVGRPLTMLMPQSVGAAHTSGLKRYLETGRRRLSWAGIKFNGLHKSGKEVSLEIAFREQLNNGKQVFTGIIRDITEQNLAEKLQEGRSKVLDRLAGGASLQEVLASLAQTAEDLKPEMLCSVLLLDPDKRRLRHCAAPRLPAFYNDAIDGLEIGPGVGSCGAAAYTGRRVIVQDVLTHPYWKEYRELAQRAGLRACWSEPIVSSTDKILGTFAMYYREARGPDQLDLEFIKSAAQLAGIAIERKQAETELKVSQARLRVADRLASIGTLTAGLGHDMNNVLFPIRCRLDALDWQRVPADLKDLLEATGDTVTYLQQLCAGLRLLSADPQETQAAADVTSLASWWSQVSPLITKVPDRVKLESRFPADLPPIQVAPHSLTQTILNLTINAGEAMPNGGLIRIRADQTRDQSLVRIRVTDEGVGMTQRVRLRAFDPFFTTKKRSLSTGLGLSLVHAIVTSAGGAVELESEPGRGTTVTLTFRIAQRCGTPAKALDRPSQGRATVSLGDQRIAAWVSSMLDSEGYEVHHAEDGQPADSFLWVTEPTADNLRTARRFSRARSGRQLVVLGPAGADWDRLGAIVVHDIRDLEAIRSAVRTVASVKPGA
ncbi:MAG: PAS domain S-box protein [Planctomycetota bacterium]|nr:PAS domain S-box protein [Planctomycetota bacterium]